MAIYNIYLGTPYQQLGFAIDYSPVRENLERLFQAAINRIPNPRKVNKARVQYTSQPPQLAPGELLIYLVRSRDESLWLSHSRSNLREKGWTKKDIDEWVKTQPMKDPNYNGFTMQIFSEWISEVYLNKVATHHNWVTQVIFHEAMHNASRNQMKHGAYGQLSESDPKQPTVSNPKQPAYSPSVTMDINQMSKWIASTPPPQWTDGFRLYREFNR